MGPIPLPWAYRYKSDKTENILACTPPFFKENNIFYANTRAYPYFLASEKPDQLSSFIINVKPSEARYI
jgi:hypothetical protein